jgi:hypothetical protein
MDYKMSVNGLIIAQGQTPPPKPRQLKNFMWECSYEKNLEDFIKGLEKVNAILLKVLKVPGRGMLGIDFLVIYQNEIELDGEVYT